MTFFFSSAAFTRLIQIAQVSNKICVVKLSRRRMIVGVRILMMMMMMMVMMMTTMMMMNMRMVVLSVEDYSRADFPADFVFGSGSSAYQVEGAASEDGRTPTIWDTFAHKGYYGGNGDIACDQYHKYKEDVQLMVEAGLEAYRFSISWSRLIPNGRGPLNPKGLEYYNNLINELLKHGIQPHVTLCHIDTPQALEDEYGGWLSRIILKDFAAYADICFKEFGDRVLHWTTLNELNIFALGGYDNGLIPPGRCSDPFGLICTEGNSTTEPYIAAHHMLLAHAAVFELYNKKYKAIQHGYVGINIYAPWFVPVTQAKEDVIATQRAIDFFIGWIMDPLVYGDYPDIMKKNAGSRIPAFTSYESKLVKGSFDFVGINHYYVASIKDNPSSLNLENRDISADMALSLFINSDMAANGEARMLQQFRYSKNASPWGLFGLLEYMNQAYGNPPVYIHENGLPTPRNGSLKDTTRVEYIHAYIGSMLEALRNGSNTKGYFLWSFLDSYELLDGYQSGCGLYYVDLDDVQLRRYPKFSAHWYSNFLKGRNVRISEVIQAEDSRFAS